MATYTSKFYTSFNSGGNNVDSDYGVTRREFILPDIAYHQAVETPLLSSLPQVSVGSVLFEWVMGKYSFDWNSTTMTQDVEGKQHLQSSEDVNNSYRNRASNYLSIVSKDIMVSNTQRWQNEVGVSDEFAQQVHERGVELRQEMERILLFSTQSAGAGDPDTAAARKTHGLVGWAFGCDPDHVSNPIIAGNQIYTSSSDSAAYNSLYYKGTGVNLTRDVLNDEILEPFWFKGGELGQSIMMVGAKVKKLISSFGSVYAGSGATLSASPLNERSIPAMAKTLIDRIDVYESDFGPVYVNKNRYMNGTGRFNAYGYTTTHASSADDDFTPNDSLLLIDPRFLAIGVGRPFHYQPLAKLGDSTQGFLLGEMGLIVRNPRAICAATDIAA